jgi:hypothetical protein
MIRRQTYVVRFHQHEKPYRISAAHRYQADIIASKLAAKYNWTVASVGVLVR